MPPLVCLRTHARTCMLACPRSTQRKGQRLDPPSPAPCPPRPHGAGLAHAAAARGHPLPQPGGQAEHGVSLLRIGSGGQARPKLPHSASRAAPQSVPALPAAGLLACSACCCPRAAPQSVPALPAALCLACCRPAWASVPACLLPACLPAVLVAARAPPPPPHNPRPTTLPPRSLARPPTPPHTQVFFESCGHWLYIEQPTEFNRLVADFALEGFLHVGKVHQL